MEKWEYQSLMLTFREKLLDDIYKNISVPEGYFPLVENFPALSTLPHRTEHEKFKRSELLVFNVCTIFTTT